MKKIILSVAVATMALSTVASALEDIKVSGQAKLWYETQDAGSYLSGNDAGTVTDKNLLDAQSSTGEVVFKLGMTGKQGNVGFGTTLYQSSSMGLQGTVVGGVRNYTGSQMYVGEAYITAPLVASTMMKFGKQELDTPLAFTERWNSLPNTFNAALVINSSVKNLTMIAGYIGESGRGELGLANQYNGDGFALAGLYKTDAFGVNVWAYQINNVGGTTNSTNGAPLLAHGGASVQALWVDANVKAGPVAVKLYGAAVMNDSDSADVTTGGVTKKNGGETTSAFALSVAGKAGPVTLFGAATTVSDNGDLPVANTATNFKKTKLPTAGVYTDGLYIAQPGSTSFKLKASGKAGSTGLALQYISNANSGKKGERMGIIGGAGTGFAAETLETQEIDLIITQKLGDFNFKFIGMNRSFADSDTDKARGGNHVRVVTSVNF